MAKSEAMALENAHFIPSLPKERMPEALAAADACIAILKPIDAYKTTFPNKVFDYMAAGRPVVLVIDGVIRDVVERANAGVFVPPGDPDELARAIRRLSDDPQAVERMGQNGRTHVVGHFDRSALATKMSEVMRELLGENGSG